MRKYDLIPGVLVMMMTLRQTSLLDGAVLYCTVQYLGSRARLRNSQNGCPRESSRSQDGRRANTKWNLQPELGLELGLEVQLEPQLGLELGLEMELELELLELLESSTRK